MAEIIVSAVITVVCEKLIAGDLMKLAQSEGIDSKLKKWKTKLPLIQAVLADAGKKQITESAVRRWLNDLQDLAYDIEDVLDELATEALRRKLNQESHASTSTSKLFKLVPTCCTTFSPRNLMYGQQMSSKLDDITNKLNDLVEVKNGLGLNVSDVKVESSDRTEGSRVTTAAVIDEPKITGREGDKAVLLGKLLANNENVSIVSIVGMGGLGKTTLAQILYNDNKVKEYFELRSWVCVSEEFNVRNICQEIFQKANGGKNQDFASLDLLHEALKEKLQKIRFLIVLDDVWNEEESKWELLKSPLVGAPGSKIMDTTRNTKVASVMDSDETYHLDVLSDEDALSLFAQHALGEKSFEKHPSLKLHGEGIVKKCGRLPLALKTLGRVLKGKRNGEEWEKLLKSEIWDIHDGKGILPALRLSYYHLPAYLKQPFAYCSSYPKDYVFDKKELVLLWMAQGYLSQSHGYMSMESLGYEYFEELKSRSFFQHSTNDESGYTMHDLVNDLATSVAGEFFFRLDDEMDASNNNETFENFRHVSLVGKECGSYRKFYAIQRAARLRTLLLVPSGWSWSADDFRRNVLVELPPKLKFLRVLSLANQGITEVPKSIGSLKHLRYLNLSKSEITCLPQEVSDLHNLQSLLLQHCYRLCSLPESFGKLINLRHLDLWDTPKVKKMPLGIGGLISLQTLPKVIITEGANNGFKISELKGLSELQGRLCIMGLEKVINPIEAKDANIDQKKGLDVLEMIWSKNFEDSWNEMTEFKVLEALRPRHDKLRILRIMFYKGTTFPNWVGDPTFDLLTELRLYGCRSTHLPTLGQLQSLRKLVVERMKEVKTVGFELLAPTTNSSHATFAFPSLEVLKFDDMECWERWSTGGGDHNEIVKSFPCLREISINDCPKLSELSIGLIPSLRVLDIRECSESVLRSMIGASSSLVELEMWDVKGLTQLNEEDLRHLGALGKLTIKHCDELRYLSISVLVSLKELCVDSCRKLVSLGEKEVNWESLKTVMIWICDSLESYNCSSGVETLEISSCGSFTSLTFATLPSSLTESMITDCHNNKEQKRFGFLPLRRLQIYNCKNFCSFPHEYLQSFTSLEELVITSCPRMDSSFPCGSWPPNLRELGIGELKKPMSEWGLQNFPTSLVKLTLDGENSGITSFAVVELDEEGYTNTSSQFLLPPSLVELRLFYFEDVESLSEVLQRLRGLKRLDIRSCTKLKDLPQTTSSLTVYVWR